MPSPRRWTDSSPHPGMGSVGRGIGSTWSAIPTSSTRSGAIETGSSGPSTRTWFIVHQVAGDRLPAPAPGTVNADGIVATTMLAIGPWGGIDRPKRLADIVDDQIDTIGRSFLGLTIACARCHDHKFDPISTADYYGLAGFFFSSRILSDQAYLSHTAPRLTIPLVFLLTKDALNLGSALQTIVASSDSSTSIQWGGHTDGCIPATKPLHAS
jgi:hypothetical protein